MKKRTLFHSAEMTVALMIAATMVSKALGMLRQMMTASVFGASMEGIAFSAASGIPLAIFDMLFSTAILGSFLPIYKGHLGVDTERARSFSSSFFTVVFLLTALVSILGMAFARSAVMLAAPDLDENTAALSAVLLRIMFPSMIFAGAAYILIGILQSHEKFLLPACVSAISNLLMLLYLRLCPTPVGTGAAVGLAVSYLLSWVLQFLTLAVPLWKRRAFPPLTVKCRTSDTVLAAKRALPVMFGSWLIPMTALIAKAFSSFVRIAGGDLSMSAGAAIVVYENAFSVFSIAAGLLTYGICNYLFPKLAARFSSGQPNEFSKLIQKGFFAAAASILPVSGALFLLSEEIVGLLYLRGHFTNELAAATAESLKILSFALPAYGLSEFFSRVCYACAKVRYPMWASLSGVGLTLLSGAFFLYTGSISVGSVALSVVLGQTVAGLLLLFFSRCFFEKESVYKRGKYVLLLCGSLMATAVMWLCRNFFRQIFHFSRTFQNFLILAIVFTAGSVVYLIWLMLVGLIRVSDLRSIGREEKI